MRALLLGCVLTAASVVIVELALRATGNGPESPVASRGADAAPGLLQFEARQRDPRDGMTTAHAGRGYALRASYRSSPEHTGSYALGEYPWRGRPAEPAPQGIVRVAVFGDSCAFGIGVETAETLPARLALELEALGHDRSRVQVLNFGVPGYSTVQVARVLDEVLLEIRPDVAVFYVAAANDGAPAASRSDADLLERPSVGDLARRSAIVATLRRLMRSGDEELDDVDPVEPLDQVELMRVWSANEYPHGPRVAADEVEPRVRAMIGRARSAGCASVVVVPAHPAATEAEHARVLPDRASVRRAAEAERVPLVDADRVAAESGLPDTALFVDFVHPSPELWTRVAHEVAAAVAPLLGVASPEGRETTSSPLRVVAVDPFSCSSFGDARIVVEVDPPLRRDEPVAVVVGGASLLDVRVEPNGRASGIVPTNASGPQDVLVQTARGVAVAPGALLLRPPTLDRDGEGLVVHSREGDLARLYLSSAIARRPASTLLGAAWIDPGRLVGPPLERELGGGGTARFDLPDVRPLFAQALVVPHGEDADGLEARLTAPVSIEE
ncbi:MAG: GDSL-type esterase/lipase family protein [Planctomycetota bacterium]